MPRTATDSYLKCAFDAVIENAREPETWYVCLMHDYQYYGGPEEGGWWGTDSTLAAYHQCNSKEEADQLSAAVLKLAEELNAESRKAHGEQCLRELDWLEARGLDADWLPEPDGGDSYRVVVSQGLPSARRGPRHYE